MHHRVFIGFLAVLSLFLVGFSSHTVPLGQAGSGIVWQSYSLDDQGDWQLDSIGQNFTQTRSSLTADSAGLIDQPSLLSLHGRIPEGGLILILDANITVGATWDLVGEIPGVKLEILDFSPYSDLRGSPGRMTLRITSTSLEIQDIQLTYHRPWLLDEIPGRKLAISAFRFPQSIDLSHKIIINAPPASEIETNPFSNDFGGSTYSQTSFPLDFDWRNNNGNYVTLVRDQRLCGSCWAHAIIGATESALLIDGVGFDADTLDLSEQYLVSCRTDAMNAPCGGWNSSANNYHLDKYGQIYNRPGAVLESSFPYVGDSISCGFGSVAHPYKITSYTYVGDGMSWSPHDSDPVLKRANIELIKSAIYNHGPVGAGMYTRINWCESSSCDPYVEPPEAEGAVNHDILIVGWHDDGDLDFTDDYWIVKNSFGPTWHSNGYVNISFYGPVIGTGAYYVDFTPGKYRGDLAENVFVPLVKKPISGLPGTWVTLVNENFEGDFPDEHWYASNGGATLAYYWGQSDCRASTTGGQSMWWVGAGGTPLTCGAIYPEGINSSLFYGPIDLSSATSAFMKFDIWINTLPTFEYKYYDPLIPSMGGYGTSDSIIFGAGTGPDLYNVWSIRFPGSVYGNSTGWREMILDFSNLDSSGFSDANMLGLSNVYIYFGGVSNDYAYISPEYSEGVFIDDVLIKKCVGGTCMMDW